jgi:TolB-like protein
MDTSRQLAVILFADMVGYTSLMQADEKLALKKITDYQSLLDSAAQQFNGKLVKNYGDGSLMTFSNSIDAVRAAMHIQRQAQMDPQLQLRIGIHVGEFIIEDGDIYGNGVNLASRIESLGIAGAVLFSDGVFQKIKNRKEFKTQSVGHFNFKHVEDVMEVFALANDGIVIPRQSQLHGKGKAVKKKAPLRIKIAFVLLPLIFIAVIYQFWFGTKDDLFEKLKEERIAVLIFKNNTGNPNLDYIGEMASEWITRALMETNEAKVVNANSVKQNKKLASIFPTNQDSDAFSRITGAKYLIRGSYYLENGELIFSSQVNDIRSETVHFSFEEFKGNSDEPSKVIGSMKNKIAGYWLTQEKVLQSKFAPPNKDSWLEYQKGRTAWGASDVNNSHRDNIGIALEHFKKAINLDSTFMLPWIELGMAYFNLEPQCDKPMLEAHFQIMETKRDLMSDYEWNVFQIDKYRFADDHKLAYKFAKKNYELDPLGLRDNFLYGLEACQSGRIKEAIEAHTKIDLDLIPNNTDRKNLVMNLLHAYMADGKFDKISEIISYGTYPWHEHEFKFYQAFYNNSDSSVLALMKAASSESMLLKMGGYAERYNRQDLAQKIYKYGLELYPQIWRQVIFQYHLKEYRQSLSGLEKLFKDVEIEKIPSKFLLYLFLNYQKNGNSKKANKYLEQLEKFENIECPNERKFARNNYMTALAIQGRIKDVEELLINTGPISPYAYFGHHIELHNAMKSNPHYPGWIN